MVLAIGKTEYVLGEMPVVGYGVSFLFEELVAAIKENVYDVLFDTEGVSNIVDIIDTTSDTGFSNDRLIAVLTTYNEEIEDWRVGEALSEVYLSENKGGFFPWPNRRDIKKFGSSLAGADLVGFHCKVDSCCFLFGETKTSQDSNYPPSPMYGDHGLKQQVEDLCCKESLRWSLVRYLGYRAKDSSWEDLYQKAFKRFLQNSSDVYVFGMMVRDVVPNKRDLNARVVTLGKMCPDGMKIEMLAIYLPKGKISDLPHLINNEKERRAQYAE
jgi:hypothetical protein